MSVYVDDGDVRLYHGDALTALVALPTASVHCCVTSPPYWGLRDYGVDGQLGLEQTPEEYVAAMVAVFRAVRRVLRPDGTLWLNVGDSYAADGRKGRAHMGIGKNNGYSAWTNREGAYGLEAKQLIGIPWRLALALQADGWWLRSDIIWSKLNPMPESVTDRPTSAHEHVFLLTPSAKYHYDADAVREGDSGKPSGNGFVRDHRLSYAGGGQTDEWQPGGDRNLRNVWTIATEPTPEAHFATFPQALVERCLKAGTSERGVCADCGAPWRRVVERGAAEFTPTGYAPPGSNGRTLARGTAFVGASAQTTGWEPACACEASTVPATVLDPFVGSGTTALVARRLGLRAVGIDLSASYLAIAARRLQQLSLFAVEGVPAQEGRA